MKKMQKTKLELNNFQEKSETIYMSHYNNKL